MDLLNFGDDDHQQADAPTPPRHPDPAPRTPQRPPGGSLMDDYLGLDSPLVATASSSMAASSQHRGGSSKSRRTGGAGTESKTTKTKKKSSSKEDKAQPPPHHHPTTNGASHGSSSNGGGAASAAPKPCRMVVVRSKAVKVEVSVLVEHGLVTLQLRVKNNTSGKTPASQAASSQSPRAVRPLSKRCLWSWAWVGGVGVQARSRTCPWWWTGSRLEGWPRRMAAACSPCQEPRTPGR